MALRERAALAVLAGQAHRIALVEQRAESQGFARSPIHAFAALDHLAAIVEEALYRLVQAEAARRCGDARGDLLDLGDFDAGHAAPIVVDHVLRNFEAGPAPVEPVGLVGLVALARFEFGLQTMAPVAAQFIDFALGDEPFVDELLGVDFERRRMRANDPVHQRLREAGLVAFVVAVAAITEHVDDDRLVEALPVFDRDLRAMDDRLGIIAIDMEDRRLDELGDVGRIGRRARIARISREADLIVDDEMHRAAGAMAA